MTLIPEEGEGSGQRLHSLLLAAASPLLATLLADHCHHHSYTVHLPGVPLVALGPTCLLLYGNAVVVTKEQLGLIYQLGMKTGVMHRGRGIETSNYIAANS